jgi:eukaryotic-like serine/threonine-protein kinase
VLSLSSSRQTFANPYSFLPCQEHLLKKLGKYEVLGELGHGAMGVVYRARDPIINRLVALKTITTGVADDPAMLQRFYREAQSAGGLQHPNIVTIYDMGEAAELPYIAMELVEGENLEQLIARRSAVPLSLKLLYAMQACRAFDYAHKRGIVHRDIKPGNVMVNKDGTVKVVDFGIARVLETSRTQTGMLIGTFAYMSPEQYHGEHADERSDIWSFGVLFYELLTYQKPFSGPTPASLMHNICNEEPTPLGKVLPECPKQLELAVFKMLRKSPGERYQSMEDVLLDLDPICRTLQSQAVAELLQQTRQLFDEQRYAEARDLARQAVQLESTNQEARGLLDKSNAELKRILNRPKVQQLVEKGRALLGEGKLQEAEVAAEQALQLDSTFTPAEELQRAIDVEVDRIRQISEWLEAAKQHLAEGLPDKAENLLAKVLETEPSNAQAKSLQQRAMKEKAEREKARRLSQGLEQARELWTQQHYDDCLKLLQRLGQDFPGEEEIARLFETVRDDLLEQQRRQALLEARNLLASGRHDDAIALLSGLQKQFSNDEEIPPLLQDVRKDQMNQRRLQGLAEARSLLATGRYDSCTALLTSLSKSFPDEQEIPRLLETSRQNQAEQARQQGLKEAAKLLAERRYNECITFLAGLEKQFPGDPEILALEQSVRAEQARLEKQQQLEEAQRLLAARRYEQCSTLLAALGKRFPADEEIHKLQSAVAEDQARHMRLERLEQARNFLASRNFDKCLAVLASLHKENAEDEEARKLLESVHRGQTEQRKQEALSKARDLLGDRKYDESVGLLTQLEKEFPEERVISKLLESARREQAEHSQREGIAQARSLLATRRYDDSITVLSRLLAEFPGEPEITRLVATAREGLAEQEKEQKLADARSLLAARLFPDALALLNSLAAVHPKDAVVAKLRALVQREQEKHVKEQKLQRELDALKKLMADKKYPDVIARATELLAEVPSEPNLLRLSEFASARQASIEKELLLKQKLEQVKSLFDATRFEDAMRVAQNALKTFPANPEFQSLYEQSEIQQKKLQVRQQIEHRIREIRVKINREELSEAVDLAKQTLMTLGPDTDLTHLLNSAQVELQAREKKRSQETALETIRTLIDAGELDRARQTIDEVVETQSLDSFDPRIERLAARIRDAQTAATSKPASTPSQPVPGLSKEYAFLQATPLPDAPPLPDKTPPPDSATVTPQYSAGAGGAAVPHIAPGKPGESAVVAPEPTVRLPAKIPPAKEKSVVPSAAPAPAKVQHSPSPAVSPATVETRTPPQPGATPLWRRPAVFGILILVAVSAVWVGMRSKNVKAPAVGTPVSQTTPQPAKPIIDPLETEQRQALDAADKRIAANDLDGAISLLQQPATLNGPLTSDIQKKLAQIEESKKDANLRQLRQGEEVLWQRATHLAAEGKYAEAQKVLKQILAIPAGGVHRDDAQQYLTKTIPQQQAQNRLLAEGHQNLAQGNFEAARHAADQLKQNGGKAYELEAQIDQAELARLKQLESQFEQLKTRDDEAAMQQLKALQPQFQALADGGPQSSEATSYANNVSGAMADLRSRADKRAADAAFQQLVQKYRQASANNDKSGLTAARGDFQTIVQNGGAHAESAQQYVAEINNKLDALNAPAPVVKEAPVATVSDETLIRGIVQKFFQYFEQRNPDALRQVWPSMPQKRYDGYRSAFGNVSEITIQVISENVKISPDGTSATVMVQSEEQETPKTEKRSRKFTPSWTFQLSKANGNWQINDVL